MDHGSNKQKHHEHIQIIDIGNDHEELSDDDFQRREDVTFVKSNNPKMKDIQFLSRKIVPPTYPNYLILCKLCFKRKVSEILYPCQHACICTECFYKLEVPKICPICNNNVNRNTSFILCS